VGHADRNSTKGVGAEVGRTGMGRADGPTLVFDGECDLCTVTSRWIAARWTGPGNAVPYQELDRLELVRLGLSTSQVRDAAWWVDEDGTAWSGHQAIARSLTAGGGWRRSVGRALLVPPLRWLGSAAYPIVAHHRRRLPGNVLMRRPQGDGGA
jgi:predicted DCC family thiol-disulfide oxidoreductase YuxK